MSEENDYSDLDLDENDTNYYELYNSEYIEDKFYQLKNIIYDRYLLLFDKITLKSYHDFIIKLKYK